MLQATGLPRVRHGSAPEQQLLLSLKLPPPHRLPSLPRPHHWSREGPWASPPGPPGPILWARPPCLHPHPQASLSLEDLPPHSPAPPPTLTSTSRSFIPSHIPGTDCAWTQKPAPSLLRPARAEGGVQASPCSAGSHVPSPETQTQLAGEAWADRSWAEDTQSEQAGGRPLRSQPWFRHDKP